MREMAAIALLAVLLVGCSGLPFDPLAAQTPSPIVRQPSASATPATGATPSPSGSPRPTVAASTPPAVDADVVIGRFMEFARAWPPFHMRVDARIEGTMAGERLSGRTVIEADVAGNDIAGTIQITARGAMEIFQVVMKNGRVWARYPSGRWLQNPEFRQTQPVNPFTSLKRRDVAYRGLEFRSGKWLHVLRIERWIGDDPSTIPGIKKARIVRSQFDIFVGDDGIPVSGDLEFGLTGRLRRQPVELSYVCVYEFSRVGQQVTIEAPRR